MQLCNYRRFPDGFTSAVEYRTDCGIFHTMILYTTNHHQLAKLSAKRLDLLALGYA
jgi:hypothetical protein